MALQQSVLLNGEWVTRDLDPLDMFKTMTAEGRAAQQLPAAPSYGLLTKTVIPSPIIRWILPAQLRSAQHNDVAMVGDYSITIRELTPDTELEEITRADFDCRIRRACVIGLPKYRRSRDSADLFSNGLDEASDVEMADSSADFSPLEDDFPPQLLSIVLETGQLVFLYVTMTANGGWDFVRSIHDIPGSRLVGPGYHMAVDPSSRYLMLGCHESLFLVYHLRSIADMRSEYSHGRPFDPIISKKARGVIGVIHTAEFLYPKPQDRDWHVILMLIIVRNKISRMATYDWELNDDLSGAFEKERKGHRLEDEWSMPLLVVPLTVRHSFLLITEAGAAICADSTQVPLHFERNDLEDPEKTLLHFGKGRPVWTAWSRPVRLPEFHDEHDVIYLAREDGFINFLEIGYESSLETSVSIGSMECNIDLAFTCMYHDSADVLVTGGDSGAGGIWNVQAREMIQRIRTIPNWSPTVDFIVAPPSQGGLGTMKSTHKARSQSASEKRPFSDRLFTCSGRGQSGAISEFRYGLEAKAIANFNFETPIRQCWVLPKLDQPESNDFFLVLAIPNRSAILLIAGDFMSVEDLPQEQVPYDLSCNTLAMEAREDRVIQLTTSSITVVTPSMQNRWSAQQIVPDSSATFAHAAIQGDLIAIALNSGPRFRIAVVQIQDGSVEPRLSFDVDGEVTCIALAQVGNDVFVVAGIWQGQSPCVSLQPVVLSAQTVQPPARFLHIQDALGLKYSDPVPKGSGSLEALTSVVILERRNSRTISLVFGTRNGHVITATLDTTSPDRFQNVTKDQYGASAALVLPFSTSSEPPSIFVACDSTITVLADLTPNQHPTFLERHRVWSTDREDDAAEWPAYNFVTRLPQPTGRSKPLLVMVAESQVIIAELAQRPGPIIRKLKLTGTPLKLIYSQRLDSVIVAVVDQESRPSLHFIDPSHGEDLSFPTRDDEDVDFIKGLGQPNNQILGLTTWSYEKGGHQWEFILLSVRTEARAGRLLVISADRDDRTHRVHFFTRWRKDYPQPIYSMTSDAQGLFLCSGDVVHYVKLNVDNRKFEDRKHHKLQSPASWMEVVSGKLHVCTIRHSLEVLDYTDRPDSEDMIRLYSDDETKMIQHLIRAREGQTDAITLVSDMSCNVWGMWTPPYEDAPLRTIFQAEIQASVKRFALGNTRPPWVMTSRTPKYGYVAARSDGSEILGIGLDGSLRHFALMDIKAWRFLRFVQNLASLSADLNPFEPLDEDIEEDEADMGPHARPLSKQVNGDILQRVLDSRKLAELIQYEHEARFRQLLDSIDGGVQAKPLTDMAEYIDLAYDMLKYYLSPLL